jgi:hypothetical protein
MEEDPGEPTATRLAARVPGIVPGYIPTDYNALVQDCTRPPRGLPNLPKASGLRETRRSRYGSETPQFCWKDGVYNIVASVLLNFRGMVRQGF